MMYVHNALLGFSPRISAIVIIAGRESPTLGRTQTRTPVNARFKPARTTIASYAAIRRDCRHDDRMPATKIAIPMKILHVADFLPGLHNIAGGAEFATLRTIEEQVAAGLEVEVATLPIVHQEARRGWSRHHEYRNIDPLAPRLAYAVKQLYFPGDALASAGVAAIIAKSRPDVVHFHNLHFSGLSVVGKAQAAGVASAWTIYDYWVFCPSFMLLTSSGELCVRGHGAHCVDCIGVRRARALRPLKRALFDIRPSQFSPPVASVDRLVALSDASRDLLVGHGVEPSRIAVLPQYLWNEAAVANDGNVPEPGRLLYVGWVEQRKGLHVVVEAMGQLADEFPDLHLDVLGMAANVDYQKLVDARVRELGLAQRVRVRGKTGRAELIAELRCAFLVTIPEQWENMSPVILAEAMAAGACVLASRIGGIRHIVEDRRSGLLAERDDPREFAECIRWAMHNRQRVIEMGKAARARAASLFDPAVINRRTVEMYQSIIRPARREQARERT